MNLKNKLAELRAEPKTKQGKSELGKQILSARFLSEIQKHLELDNVSRKDFAKKMGVSASFVSQLYNGEKVVNMDFLNKVQEMLNLKFYISTIDKVEFEDIVDKAVEKIFKQIIEIEKQLNEINKTEDDEDGIWEVYYSKKPVNYEKLDQETNKESYLKIAI